MANIFKTTLKKDVIAEIANNNQREIRFPITKFWASRFTDEYNLEEKKFIFKEFDTLEFSSPSNKDTVSETYVFSFIRTFVDGDEFVVEFKDIVDVEDIQPEVQEEIEAIIPEYISVVKEYDNEPDMDELGDSDDIDFIDFQLNEECDNEDIQCVDVNDVFNVVKQWFEYEGFLDKLYDDEFVFATNARQVIILPKGKILGSNKVLPVNNDVEVRVEFDMNKRVYFDATFDIDEFKNDIFTTLGDIRKNNFLFIWKRYTGIFMDVDGGIYFGIKYSTRKSIGFNRKYNVQ
jgi:hypothetical protein